MKKKDFRFGEITEIFDEEEYSNGFRKTKFLLKTFGNYSQELLFELHREKADYITSYEVGDVIRVFFDIKGNQGTDGKYYTNLIAWCLEYAG